jgi:hypothetical protein
MSASLSRINKRRKALEVIKGLVVQSAHVLIIHYSCESFYDIKDGRTPRVTSIAVRSLKTAQTKSFSIHKIAERKKLGISQIEEFYDELEQEMLAEFFAFVGEHKSCSWVHWNMRDINFGFEAIQNRYVVLGGIPETINDENKFDLARLITNIYGSDYIEHPRLEKLVERNGITNTAFLAGKEEAVAFDNKEYIKLHQSTLRKVDVIHTIIERVVEGSLKTNAKLTDIYGLTPQGIFELTKDNWLLSMIFAGIGLLLGAVLGNLLG